MLASGYGLHKPSGVGTFLVDRTQGGNLLAVASNLVAMASNLLCNVGLKQEPSKKWDSQTPGRLAVWPTSKILASHGTPVRFPRTSYAGRDNDAGRPGSFGLVLDHLHSKLPEVWTPKNYTNRNPKLLQLDLLTSTPCIPMLVESSAILLYSYSIQLFGNNMQAKHIIALPLGSLARHSIE